MLTCFFCCCFLTTHVGVVLNPQHICQIFRQCLRLFYVHVVVSILGNKPWNLSKMAGYHCYAGKKKVISVGQMSLKGGATSTRLFQSIKYDLVTKENYFKARYY